MEAIEDGTASKHDDFFDDPPAVKPLENGHVSPEPAAANEPEVSTTADVAASDDGGATEAGGEQAAVEPDAEVAEPTEDAKAPEEEEEKEEVSANVGVTTNGSEDVPNGTADAESTHGEETVEAPADPQPSEDAPEAPSDVVQTEEGGGEAPTPPEIIVCDNEDNDREEVDPPSRQTYYTEDFSDNDEPAPARETPIDNVGVEDAEDKKSDAEGESPEVIQTNIPEESGGGGGGGDDDLTPSDAPAGGEEEEERTDSRAEAAQVIPVAPPEEEETKKSESSDGRSSSASEDHHADGDAYRGEDRMETAVPEGSEDCRGQGQWKSPEQQAVAAAMLTTKSEREIAEEAVKERDTMRADYETLQERHKLAIKDLQERLAILARENEDKDKRIFQLEDDVRVTKDKLRDTQQKLIQAEERAGAEPPKSKTCTIM